MSRKANILITGTPGTGKSVTSRLVAERTGLNYIDVGKIVKENDCHTGKDDEFDSYILDEDKLCDYLEPIINEGGNIIDFHSPEVFEERWFDLVLVLKSRTEILYDRLTARGYDDKKRNENMECEIMQVVLESARECYNEEMICELDSNEIDDMESNVDRICTWYENWKQQNK